jgi:hypothetical protein
MMGGTMKRSKGLAMTRWRAVLAALGVVLGLGLLAVAPAEAGSGNTRAIHDLRTLRYVDRVVVVDVSIGHDRYIWAKRAHQSVQPLTALQTAIVNNRPLIEAINRTVWSFDLKSIYAARVEGYTVYLYMGDPPPT